MSRIGRKPVVVPAGVEITVDANNVVTVKGPKGQLSEEISKLIMPAAGYIAVSDVQGVKLYNSMKYFFATYLKSISNGTISTEGLNVMNIDSLVTKSNSKIIHLFDYSDNNINNMYSSKQIITDSKDLKSYVFTIEKKYITENACKLVSKLRVNPEANFSKIVGYTVKYDDILPIDNITKENTDFDVELKVGQKYKIISNNKIESYELKGADCIKIDQKNNEIIIPNNLSILSSILKTFSHDYFRKVANGSK